MDQVRASYDSAPEFEWARLEGRVQDRIEFLVTKHALQSHLPRAGHILDAGGGPGRYTIELAQRGYRVTLLDLSPSLLRLAREKIAEAGPEVADNVAGVVEGSITDLAEFEDASFDAVICLGSVLSHVLDAAERRRATLELKRVTKPGAPVVISVQNHLSTPRSFVQWPYLWDVHPEWMEPERIGTILNGAPMYDFMPEEFVELLRDAGLNVIDLYGCQGIAAHLPADNLESLMAHEQRWPIWRERLLATANHPSIVGVSCHLIAVARQA